MKKTILLTLAIWFLAGMAWAGYDVKRYTIMDGSTAIAAGDDYSSATLTTFSVAGKEGVFTVQASTTGSGTMKIEYYASIDGTTFVEPTGASDIMSGITSASGTKVVQVPLATAQFAAYIRIVVTETGSSNSITPTIYLLFR